MSHFCISYVSKTSFEGMIHKNPMCDRTLALKLVNDFPIFLDFDTLHTTSDDVVCQIRLLSFMALCVGRYLTLKLLSKKW